MKAKSIKGKNLSDIQSALSDSMSDGFKPSLAVVFMSVKIDHNEITSFLDSHDIQVFGATTNGEFIDEEIGKESIAILLLNMNPDWFEFYFETLEDKDYLGASQRVARAALGRFANPGFLISGSGLETNAEEFLKGIEQEVGDNVELYGSMAGDDFIFDKQYVFTNGQDSFNGLLALAIDLDRIEMKGNAICGWKPVGTEKTVTHSEGNHIYTIDDQPALDITAKYGGITNLSESNENLLMEMATLCPLQLQRENAPAIMRPGLVVDWSDHSLICSGSVPQGSKVKFCLPPDFDAIEAVIKGYQALRDSEMPEADAVIYFTCAGRLVTFGPMMEQEIAGIQEIWNAPMVGMFSNAELGRAKGGKLEFHNLSSCCVALKEKVK